MKRPATLPVHPSDVQGLGRLAIDGVIGVTDLVEHVHATVATTVFTSLGARRLATGTNPERTAGLTGRIYRSVRGVTKLVGGGLDLALSPLTRWPGEAAAPSREHFLAVINGVLGDHLESTGNPLAIDMALQHGGQPLSPSGAPIPAEYASSHVVVFLHGLCLHPGHWTRDAESAVEALPERVAHQPGRTALHLQYNSGRSIDANGRELTALLDDLHARWPVPIEQLSLVGHSMGGLVARSAAHHGTMGKQAWTATLERIITLGSPHAGAPLERAGHRFETMMGWLPYTRPFNRLGRMRSAGIIDLRHGRITDRGVTPMLPEQTRLHLLAASRSPSHAPKHAGDGLVPIDSALALAAKGSNNPVHHHRVHECGHIDLMHHPEAAERVLDWLDD